jgi:hypothetical protein
VVAEDHVLVGGDEVDPVLELVRRGEEPRIQGVHALGEVGRVVAVAEEEEHAHDGGDGNGRHRSSSFHTVPRTAWLPTSEGGW